MKKYSWDDNKYSLSEIIEKVKPKSYKSARNSDRIGHAYNLIELNKVNNYLDIGCETGRFLDYVHHYNSGIKLTGVDCNQSSIDIANDVFGGKDIHFELIKTDNKLPFENNTFSLVTFFEVLEHVRSVDDYLKEVKRVLKSDGRICLSVPNALWWRNALKHMLINKVEYSVKMEQWPDFAPDQRDHVNSYDFITLYRILNLNGFKLINYGYADIQFSFLNKTKLTESLSSTMIIYLERVN